MRIILLICTGRCRPTTFSFPLPPRVSQVSGWKMKPWCSELLTVTQRVVFHCPTSFSSKNARNGLHREHRSNMPSFFDQIRFQHCTNVEEVPLQNFTHECRTHAILRLHPHSPRCINSQDGRDDRRYRATRALQLLCTRQLYNVDREEAGIQKKHFLFL